MDNNLIPIREYAEMHGIDPATVSQRNLSGAIRGAVMLANSWFVPRDLPLTDNRRCGRSKRWKDNQEE